MRKWNYKTLTAACLCGLMVIGAAGCASTQTSAAENAATPTAEATTENSTAAETTTEASAETGETADGEASASQDFLADTYEIWGPVLWVENDQISIDNQSELSYQGEIILNIDPEATYILDGRDGYPVDLSEISKDEVIYAYIGPAMTMSLPPQTTAKAVICQIPEDSAAARYVTVKAMEQQKDESYLLTTADGTQYQVPADCQIIPYLTRNLVRLTDVQTDSHCLIWSDDDQTIEKIVLFAA